MPTSSEARGLPRAVLGEHALQYASASNSMQDVKPSALVPIKKLLESIIVGRSGQAKSEKDSCFPRQEISCGHYSALTKRRARRYPTASDSAGLDNRDTFTHCAI